MVRNILFLLLFSIIGLFSNENQKNKIIGIYSMNRDLYINEIGIPEKNPLTKGFKDCSPSWSKTNNMIVFLRINNDAENAQDWLTTICVIKTDGTGFKELTEKKKYSDFNPIWTRDGSNMIIFSRIEKDTGKWYIYMTKPDANPGEEIFISDRKDSEFAHTCAKDGRILIGSSKGDFYKGIYYMLTPNLKGKGKYERIKFTYNPGGMPLRVSLSPSETKITYECAKDYDAGSYVNHSLVVADFNINNLIWSNPVEFKNSQSGILNLFPRWIKDESAIIYNSNQSGINQLYMYKFENKKTTCVSLNKKGEYGFFCGKETPY